MFKLKKLIDTMLHFYIEGFLEIPKIQMELQNKNSEKLRKTKMKEQYHYLSSRKRALEGDDKKNYEYLKWYFEVYYNKVEI